MNKELIQEEIKVIRKRNSEMNFIKEEDINIEKYFGLIYMTLFTNGMIYVGYTQRILGTKKYDEYFGSGTCDEFRRYIKSHKEKLRKEILHVVYRDEIKTDEQLFKHLERMELCFHIKTNCSNRYIGYNKMKGADGRTKGKFNVAKLPEVREKMRQKKLGTKVKASTIAKHRKNMIGNQFAKGKEHSDEWRENQSKQFSGSGNPNFGRTWKVINNDIIQRQIKINDKIPIGWKEGPLPISEEGKMKMSYAHKNNEKCVKHLKNINENKKGSRWLRKGEIESMTNKNLIQEKLNEGWEFGRLVK